MDFLMDMVVLRVLIVILDEAFLQVTMVISNAFGVGMNFVDTEMAVFTWA